MFNFFGSIYGLWGQGLKGRIARAADLLKMDAALLDKQVLEMSTGMQQKIVVAWS